MQQNCFGIRNRHMRLTQDNTNKLYAVLASCIPYLIPIQTHSDIPQVRRVVV